MQWNDHFRLQGKHAFLSASKYSWLRYSEDKLVETFAKSMAAAKGTELHAFASNAIRLGIKLPRGNKTLNRYVNDAIGFQMIPEQVLYFSDNAFGTADAVLFKQTPRGEKPYILRIHDLKTGVTPSNMDQLLIYTAFFCLEYRFKPSELDIELRIYQNDEVISYIPDPVEIINIMDKVVAFDKRIEMMKLEAQQ